MNERILKGKCACGNAISSNSTHCFECIEKKVRYLLIVEGPEKDKRLNLNQSYQSIGRSLDCEISLPYDGDISRKQGVIQFTACDFAYCVFTERGKKEIIVKEADGQINTEGKLNVNGTIELGSTVLQYIVE